MGTALRMRCGMRHFAVVVACLLLTAVRGACAERHLAARAPTLTDLWNGKATWVKDADNVGREFHFHYISILLHDRELFAYYIHNYTAVDGKFKQAVGRARGTDGIR